MADNLIFPIKFDLEAAVREAQGDADRLLRRLQTTINAKPLAVNLKIPGAGSGSINEINSRLKELVKQWNNLTEAQRITNKTTGEYTAEAKKILAEYARLRGASESYAQSLKQIDSAAKKAAKQQEKLAEAAYRGSNAFKNQDGYVSRLVKRLAVYASFQYTSQFLTNIREVTAQFELQRISLGAIIQDQQKANQIFAEIKSFALTSPLKILDLTKYAKQVAAYGFAADRVFDVTKRLADISVGLGVDMGRLTLAVSQIKAATVLKSSELRQLTETGLPMLDLLSKKLTETQGKLVSAADVMGLISKRAISYEMVEEILYDLTDAGGMFYNMQVKQSQTLFGMWSKLGDAAAIMYDQIGNTSSINAGMKLAIRSIESMMRNWKTTARVLDSVAVAMTVYIVGLKNAAIASKALTTAEATKLAIMNKQVIATPKLIASIFGQNAATSISTTLTKAHTAAMIRQSAATNILSKGLWKLTAAMLANPWVAAAAGVALVATALIHFIGNTETAADRAEKLNNSVASLKNLEDTTKPLIDTYNELIKKTERTDEEQKKLSEVTHELAKQYPGAITAVGNFGAEVELAADKLNQLYQAEKKARMDNTRYELQETEKQIASTEAKIAQLKNYLSEGKMWGGGQSGAMVPISDEERGRVLKQIDILRYGEDGQGGLNALQQSAEAARRALGLVPSEAAQAVEKFGAWKKTFTTFRKQVGDVRVQLFDDSTIAQFGSLEEALKKTAEEYKKNIALVATYDETLKSATLTSEERAKIETERAEADAMANLAEKALKYYNAMSLLNTSTSGRGRTTSDPRLQTLQEIANKMAEVNKEYDELLKKEGQTKALADTQKLFASSFKQMKATAKKYKFKLPAFEVPQTIEDVQKWYKAIMDNIKRLKLKNADKVLIELGFKSDKAAIDKQQKDIEEQIKALADKVSRTKTAKEFYDKILNMTGDIRLAANVSLQIYGRTGKYLKEKIKEQFTDAFKWIKDNNAEFMPEVEDIIDRGAYEELDGYIKLLPKEQQKVAEDLVKAQQQMSVKQYEQWLKDLEKAKDYADKRIELSRYTENQIAAIEERIAKLSPQAADYEEQKAMLEKMIGGYRDREVKETAKLEYEAFKETPLYVQMFEDLGKASTHALESMKEKLIGLQNVWGASLDPTQLKEIQSRMNEINAQLRERNPFKTLREAYQQYRDVLDSYTTSGAESNVAAAQAAYEKAVTDTGSVDSKEARAAKKTLDVENERLKIARQLTDEKGKQLKGQMALDKAAEIASENEARAYIELEQALAKEREVKANGGDIEAASNAVEAAKEKLKLAQETSRVVQEEAKTSKTLKESWLAVGKVFGDIGGGIREIGESISAIMDAFGGNTDDIQFVNDISNALGDVFGGIGDMIQSSLSGDVVGIITGAITVPMKIATGFANLFSAGKVRKANKEIKKQQELLEQLEYTYGRLEAASEKLFGREYLDNYNRQLKVLQAQQQAYLKQASAERSKGKKADEEKIKEYEQQSRDVADKIKELQDDLVAQIVGTDVASAARDFANAWLEAYLSFGSTTDAIKGKFQDMIKNMVVSQALAGIVQRTLQPMFDEIEKRAKDGDLSSKDIADVMAKIPAYVEQIDKGMRVGMEGLKAAGFDISSLRDATSEYSGIAKNIAGATSEEINTAAAIGNTLMYYVSPIPRMDENLAAIRAIMEGGRASLPTSSGTAISSRDYTDMLTTANQHLSSLPRMEQHLSEIRTMLGRIVVPKGGTFGVNTIIKS